jgi:hypothetical protein
MSLSFLVAMTQYLADHGSLADLVRWTNVIDQIASMYQKLPTF